MGSEAGVGTQINLPAAHQKPRGPSLSRVLDVGLTGGIGSGKSTVAAALRELGAQVIDADVVAREVVEPGRPTLAAVAERFGAHLIRPDGSLDRPALAAIVFPDPAALADLDRITGPAITARVRELRTALDVQAVSVYDMPLLVERRLWPHEHLSVVVGADTETRVRRLVDQRGLDEADARHRIARQATDEQRRAAADVWVDNDGTLEATHEQVRPSGPADCCPSTRTCWRGSAAGSSEGSWSNRTRRGPRRPHASSARVADALGDRAVRVEHIGSTSVPDLPAKDAIDLQVGVRRLTDADTPAFVAQLTQRGFVHVPAITEDSPLPRGDDPSRWRKRFYGSMDPGRVANVHVRELGSPGWVFALQFRDWLRADPEARQQYASLKKALAAGAPSADEYTEAKEPWFADAYPRVVGWARRTGWTDHSALPLGNRPQRGTPYLSGVI